MIIFIKFLFFKVFIYFTSKYIPWGKNLSFSGKFFILIYYTFILSRWIANNFPFSTLWGPYLGNSASNKWKKSTEPEINIFSLKKTYFSGPKIAYSESK
jgi:hypothetical protein